MEDSSTISYYKAIQQRKHADYVKVVNSSIPPFPFFDLIVLSAIDTDQKLYYENVIKEKIALKQIPSFCDYIVVNDPIRDTKVGCGGSTMEVLDVLEERYGFEKMEKMKVLLLHAGGYSKRLPNHSTSGKVFATVPFTLYPSSQSPACTMLEMKLITLIDMPRYMLPGVFLACSDDIEFFESSGIKLDKQGFIALAHPGTIDVGLSHGVFVLSSEAKKKELTMDSMACVQYLHKPTRKQMEESGAILNHLKKVENFEIFLDSCFYFDRSAGKKLLQFYRENRPLLAEIDAYGDFLQPLGERATPSYFENPKNVGIYTPRVAELREKLFYSLSGIHKPENGNEKGKEKSDQLLHSGVSLQVIPLIPSLFIHIGTCAEYMDHFCRNFPLFDFPQHVLSIMSPHESEKQQFCLVHSILRARSVSVDNWTVIEHCRFDNLNEIRIGKKCILSDIRIKEGFDFTVPDGIFMQTLCVKNVGENKNENGFVTIVFGTSDDFKLSSDHTKIAAGLLLTDVIKHFGLVDENIWEKSKSLWNASIFPVEKTEAHSIQNALKIVKVIQNLRSGAQPVPFDDLWIKKQRLSLEQCLNHKDLSTQGQMRSKHQEEIISEIQKSNSSR